MEARALFSDAHQFSAHLDVLRKDRRLRERAAREHKRSRLQLTSAERREVLRKTAGRCHICGGEVGSDWQADHVLAHSHGGGHSVDNYLPAHAICNQYRWFFGPEEFQWILKLGVWWRTQIQKVKTDAALALAEEFLRHENRRDLRRIRGRTVRKVIS
jgi:5-methylcytosine-specific restriction endonuclease McrA